MTDNDQTTEQQKKQAEMDDVLVQVPFEGQAGDKATLLLAAAEELGLESHVVKTATGAFVVPERVRDQAFGDRKGSDEPKRAARKSTTSKNAQE